MNQYRITTPRKDLPEEIHFRSGQEYPSYSETATELWRGNMFPSYVEWHNANCEAVGVAPEHADEVDLTSAKLSLEKRRVLRLGRLALPLIWYGVDRAERELFQDFMELDRELGVVPSDFIDPGDELY
jgi:hypothetical protein